MFSENLKAARKSAGFTQHELAVRLNVVRQTVSKWEKGLSVPDCDMLLKISEVLETPVSKLLGAKIQYNAEKNDIAEQLSRINAQLAVKNHRVKLVVKIVLGIIIGIFLLNIVLIIVSSVSLNGYQNNTHVEQAEQSEVVIDDDVSF